MGGKTPAKPKDAVKATSHLFQKGNTMGGSRRGCPNRDVAFREDVFKAIEKYVTSQPNVLKQALTKDPMRAMELGAKLTPKSEMADLSSKLDVILKIQALQNEGGQVDPKTITFLMLCQERAGAGQPVTPDVVMEQLSADLGKTNGKGHERG